MDINQQMFFELSALLPDHWGTFLPFQAMPWPVGPSYYQPAGIGQLATLWPLIVPSTVWCPSPNWRFNLIKSLNTLAGFLISKVAEPTPLPSQLGSLRRPRSVLITCRMSLNALEPFLSIHYRNATKLLQNVVCPLGDAFRNSLVKCGFESICCRYWHSIN